MSFTRRRQDSACLNGGDYKRALPANTSCECGAVDVECDWGWVRDCHKCTQLPEVRSGWRALLLGGWCQRLG
jgi:hypothetical protein